MNLKVLVVDDTVIFRKLVSDSLAGIAGVEVVGTASNGKLALSRIAALSPDLVTLDLEMPEMNGIEVLQAIGKTSPRPGVIMLSSHTVRGGELTIKALELGAFDFLTKPETGSREDNASQLRNELAVRIQAFVRRREARALPPKPAREVTCSVPVIPARRQRTVSNPLVLIGVSTGGPAALARVLPELPKGFAAPIFIVQHMPPLFTDALARSLQSHCAIAVKEAQDGETALPGHAYLAPGGKHMKLVAGPKGEVVVSITDDAPENHCKPSVDVLFRSVATNFPGRAVAAILTGMGSDGTAGLRHLKITGCVSIAQDEATSTVFGMPREAIAAGLADQIVPLNQIASTLMAHIAEKA
jgi:two-component system chemotaxis response regulator CheB